MHINLGHISLACLMSECCEKAPVLLSQLCMLEDSKMSGEGFVIPWRLKLRQMLEVEYASVDWNSSDTIFFFLKSRSCHDGTGHTIGSGPDHLVASKLGAVATFDLNYG